jgi:hypothetical protein
MEKEGRIASYGIIYVKNMKAINVAGANPDRKPW